MEVNDDLIFSKFRTGRYPDEASLVKEIVENFSQ